MRIASFVVVVGLGGILGVACAEVRVRKVTPENAQSLRGFRYYLPRPYLTVKKAVAVAGDEFVVQGTLVEGGVKIPVDALPEHLRYHFRTAEGGAFVHLSELSDGSRPDLIRSSEADPAHPAPLTGGIVGSGQQTAGPQGTTVELGQGEMSIVYLPDFDEQYAIEYSAGLGKVDTGAGGLQLRHGWMLDNISLSIDNVELGKFIYGQIDKFTDLASLIVARKKKVTDEFAQTLQRSSASAAAGAPKAVQLRITYALVAQPGVYPFLKPCEGKEACERGNGFVSGSRGSKDGPSTSSMNWVFVPYQPFTTVAYNVKRTVSVEIMTLESGAVAKDDRGPPSGLDRVAVVSWVKANIAGARAIEDAQFTFTTAEDAEGSILVIMIAGASDSQITDLQDKADALLAHGAKPKIAGVTVSKLTFLPGN